MIAERQHAIADDLAGLVALAGDQQCVARLQARDRGTDRLGAIADLAGAFRGRQDRRANGGGIFAARIVVGDDDRVRVVDGDLAHQWPLAGIAVAACAEHHHELALRIGPQRLQRLRQRVRLVGVIDEDRRAVAFADQFEPSLGAFEMLERREHLIRIAAGADDEPRRHQRILDLEFADQRQT